MADRVKDVCNIALTSIQMDDYLKLEKQYVENQLYKDISFSDYLKSFPDMTVVCDILQSSSLLSAVIETQNLTALKPISVLFDIRYYGITSAIDRYYNSLLDFYGISMICCFVHDQKDRCIAFEHYCHILFTAVPAALRGKYCSFLLRNHIADLNLVTVLENLTDSDFSTIDDLYAIFYDSVNILRHSAKAVLVKKSCYAAVFSKLEYKLTELRQSFGPVRISHSSVCKSCKRPIEIDACVLSSLGLHHINCP